MEIKHINIFVMEEVPRSIGLQYVPSEIKSCFQINKNHDRWRIREKK